MGGLYFALSQSEGLRLSPKGAWAPLVYIIEILPHVGIEQESNGQDTIMLTDTNVCVVIMYIFT